MKNWGEKAREDLARADKSRVEGNEGQARVCARRAAGWAASAYLEMNYEGARKKSSFQNIALLGETDILGVDGAILISNLTNSLEKDNSEGEPDKPNDLDLLADARRLILLMFPDFSE